jgi:hypothetical protein
VRADDLGAAAMGGSYMFFRNAAANLREKEDSWNPTIGGFIAGAILGTRCMTLDVASRFYQNS